MDEKGKPSDQDKQFARGRGKETLFRVTARNQIELIAIADNKANIIIGVNVLVITLFLAIFSNEFKQQTGWLITRIELIVPFGILLLASLISAIYAMLAARPNIIKPKSEKGTSKLFFQNYYRETLDEYVDDMNTVLSSREMIYRQMIIDMYYNGIVLKRKYAQLSKSYNILMAGLTIAVLTFAIIILFV